MSNMKYTEDYIRSECENKGLKFVGVDKAICNGKHRRMVNFICEEHIDKGTQIRPLEKILGAKKPCQYCNHTKLKETFVEELEKINPNIELLSDYVNTNNEIRCRCKIDGHEWNGRPLDLLKGKGCQVCGHKRVWETRGRKTTSDFIKEMKPINSNIQILGEYKGAHKLIKCKCLIDDCEWESYACNLLNKTAGCPECRKIRLREAQAFSDDEFENRLKSTNENIELLDKYVNTHTKIRFKCKTHNCIFVTTPTNFLYKNGRGCPYCSQSSGEKKMVKILEDRGFNIQQQKMFDDCRYIDRLKFDAYDIDNNVAYEYQGEQHYKPIDFAGKGQTWAEEEHKVVQKRDSIKAEYCKKNNIPLIEIPYWEFDNMEAYLEKEISKYIV